MGNGCLSITKKRRLADLDWPVEKPPYEPTPVDDLPSDKILPVDPKLEFILVDVERYR